MLCLKVHKVIQIFMNCKKSQALAIKKTVHISQLNNKICTQSYLYSMFDDNKLNKFAYYANIYNKTNDYSI